MVTWSNHLPITQQQSNPSITHSEFTLGAFSHKDDFISIHHSVDPSILHCAGAASQERSYLGGVFSFRRSGLVSEERSCFGGVVVSGRRIRVSEDLTENLGETVCVSEEFWFRLLIWRTNIRVTSFDIILERSIFGGDCAEAKPIRLVHLVLGFIASNSDEVSFGCEICTRLCTYVRFAFWSPPSLPFLFFPFFPFFL